MGPEDYEVVFWTRDSQGNLSCNTKWHGSELKIGENMAEYFYQDQLLKERFFDKQIDWRITLRKFVPGHNEVRGQLPKLIKSYGDETIEPFQRFHYQ
jgi:hypothetical protein